MRPLLIILCFQTCFCFGQQTNSENLKVLDSVIIDSVKSDSLYFSEAELQQKRLDSLLEDVINIYFSKDYASAITKGNQLIEEAENEGNIESIIKVSSFIGNSFLRSGDTIASKKIFEQNLERANKLGVTKRVLTARIDLANIYALQQNYAKAQELYLDALPVAEKAQDTISLFSLNSNIAEINLRDKKPTQAGPYLKEAKRYAGLTNYSIYSAYASMLEGWQLYLLGEYTEASRIFNSNITVLEENQFTEALVELYNYYSKSEAALGNHEAAFQLSQKYQEYQEIKYQSDKISAIEAATAKFKTEQYQQQIREQALQNKIEQEHISQETTKKWGIIASGILLIFILFLLWSARRRKKLLNDAIDKNQKYLVERERAEELSRARNILFSNVTHELRTPMYGIIGISSIILEKSLKEEDRKNVNMLKFTAEYLLSLINNVLFFNKEEANTNDIVKTEVFELQKLVQHSIETTKYLNIQGANTYEVSIDPAIPKKIIGDSGKLSQILINLLSNATKFTEKGKVSILVRKKRCDDTSIDLEFSVNDTGVGIADNRLHTIFKGLDKKDFNSSSATGSGLGLPIVKKIIDQHGGEIDITSTIDQGTQITFTLSFLTLQDTDDKKTSASTGSKEKPLAGHKILVVDDNKINQLVTQKAVERYGALVTTVGNGPDGIKTAGKTDYDLILMDINMPGMDGFETTQRIREFNNDIPIIALTAVEKEKVTAKENFNLMNDIIIKPYKDQEFLTCLLKYSKSSVSNLS